MDGQMDFSVAVHLLANDPAQGYRYDHVFKITDFIHN